MTPEKIWEPGRINEQWTLDNWGRFHKAKMPKFVLQNAKICLNWQHFAKFLLPKQIYWRFFAYKKCRRFGFMKLTPGRHQSNRQKW